MKLRDLFIRIGFDVNDKPIKDLDRGIKGLVISIGAISGAVVGAATSLFALAKTTANYGEDALLASQALGLSVTALQEIKGAFHLAGLDAGMFDVSIKQLANSAYDTSMGLTAYKKTYDGLGVSVVKSNGQLKSTDELLMQIAEKFSLMPDSLQKTAYANDLFGRSGMRMIPFLNRGAAGIAAFSAEAEASGVVLSEEAVMASQAFNLSLRRLWMTITGIKNQIGIGLMPIITDLVEDMKSWIMANQGLIKSTLQDYIKGTTKLLKSLYLFSKSVVEGIKDMSKSFGGLNKVVKMVTIALGALIALKLVYSLGLVVQGVYSLTAAFIALGYAAQVAAIKSVALAAIPLAIGAGIVALLVILQDLYVYSKGGKSVFGLLFEGAKKAWSKMSEPLTKIGNDFKAQFEGLKDLLSGIFTFDLDKIKKGLNEIYESFKKTVIDIAQLSFPKTMENLKQKGFWGSLWSGMENYVLNAQNQLSSLSAPTLPTSTINNSNVNAPSSIAFSPSVNIVVNGNTVQGQVDHIKAVVTDVLGDWWDTTLRQNHHPSLVE
ncbi:MAG TPA: hypothetical protein VMW42_07155 [Desulfatiglandales bacterium]|nr:hypothetical protein [Desulfatiglandales bacterium]